MDEKCSTYYDAWKSCLARTKELEAIYNSCNSQYKTLWDEEMIGKDKLEKAKTHIKELESLIIHQTDYIKLLTDELDEVCVLASTHGWKSTRYEEGKRLRKLIEKENKGNVSE